MGFFYGRVLLALLFLLLGSNGFYWVLVLSIFSGGGVGDFFASEGGI